MENQKRAYLFAGLSVLLWSTVASAFKVTLQYLDPIQLLLYAGLFSIVILGGILVAQKKIAELLTCQKRDLVSALLLGILNPFLYYLALFKAYDLLPAQEAQPINYTWALTLMFLSIPLLKQKMGITDFLAGLIGYFGVVVISTHGDISSMRFTSLPGVMLALGSTFFWALYWIYNKKSRLDPVVGLFLNFCSGCPLILVVCLIFSDPIPENPVGLLGAAYVGVFEMGITFVFWLYALKYSVNTARVGNLIFISPFLSLVFIHFLVGEAILPSTLIGLVFIMMSIMIQRFSPKAAGIPAP
ncbi:DMT family transporter [bacterium]|nr:DMT family transporter [bacterium]